MQKRSTWGSMLCLLLIFSLISVPAHSQLLFSKAAKEIKSAKELIEKEQYPAALEHLNTALDLSKGKEENEVYYLKGVCEYHLGRLPQAVEQLSYAVSKVNSREALPPKTPEEVLQALLYRAKTREAQQDLATANKDLQLLATSTNPSLKSEAYEKWARNLSEMGRGQHQERAELLIAKAIEVNPKNASAHTFQAQLAIYERGYEEAIASLEKAIWAETEPVEKANNKSLLGLCKYKLGEKDAALSYFKDAIDNTPESSKWKVYQQLANLVILNKLYDPAIVAQAKVWASRATILSEECSNQITLAYILALNKELTQAQATLKPLQECQNPVLKMSKNQLSAWIGDLGKAAKQNTKVKAYGTGSWYYWGAVKAGVAEGKGKALSRNFLYEVTNATFVKGALVAGTLANFSEGWTYIGAFSNGAMNGSGKITYAEGNVFTGKFVANKPQGTGKWIYTDGSTYTGNVVGGTPEGLGKYLDKEGNGYEGAFKAGKPHGKGFIVVNGKKESAEFTKGERTDAAYLAKKTEEQKAAQSLAAQRVQEEQLAKAEKRQNSGKIIGKTLALAGGAFALTKAVDLGLSTEDATTLGAALVADVFTDGKANALQSTFNTMNASANGNPLANPLDKNAAATPAAASGAAGQANDCGCTNDSEAQKYKTKVTNGDDVQVNTVCAMLKYYECMARNCSDATKAEWRKRAEAYRQTLEQMTDIRDCNW